MKKFFTIVIVAAAVSGAWYGAYAAWDNLDERGNNKESMDAAKAIAKLHGVKETAVLNLDGYVLAGISVCKDIDCQELCVQGEDILKRVFPHAKMYRIEADTDWADKVVELSFYIDTKVSRRILKKRFLYLVTENIEI